MRGKPIVGLGALGLGAVAYGVFRFLRKSDVAKPPQHAAFAEDEPGRGDPNAVRDAGAASMRSNPKNWDAIDEASDASFPSSDPPGNY